MIGAIDENGGEIKSMELKVELAPLAVELSQNHPNPFNPSTEIEFKLPEEAEVELAVYDISGRRVATIFRGLETAGVKRYAWDGRDDAGRPVPSGVYLYFLRAGKQVLSRKMVLVR